MRLLAGIGIAREVFDDAELLLAAVLELAPAIAPPARNMPGCCSSCISYSEARRELDELLEDEPENRDSQDALCLCCVGLGEHERAIALYRELLPETPADADLHLSIAHALKTLGRRAEAIESYRTGGRLPARLRRCLLEPRQSQDLSLHGRRARRRCAPRKRRRRSRLVDRYHLCFALGKALEDRGEYAESFRYYERGNALKRSESRYRPEVIETQHAPADRSLHARVLRQRARLGSPRAPTRSSSSDCRARARRCSSRFWPRTRRSRARRSWPTSSGSSSSCRAATPI